ncbi:MAG: putative Ig domain-containing protein [Bdellovibrionales bacterium]|nr:putative Ig domain-containing protein [Bdellovibrionales bacterium]
MGLKLGIGAVTRLFVVAEMTLSACTSQGPSVPVGGNPANPVAPPATVTPTLSYSSPSAIYTLGFAITANTATYTGATPTYSILPALPSGLSLDTNTGQITGTPTSLSGSTAYTVTATSVDGTATASLNLTVNDVVPTVTFPVVSPTQISFTHGSSAGLPITPAVSGGAITNCTVTPALPSGLSLSASTCAISGTPTAITAAATYTVTPSNSGGAGASTLLLIAVNDVAPGTIVYSTPAPTYVVGSGITNNTPNVTGGGSILSWSISPSLSAATGLTFSTSTGVISGTPTSVSSPGVSYTITASNSGGTSSVNMTVTVNDVPPTISYAGPYSYQAGTVVSPVIAPTLGGGTPTNCVASPALPSGFTLNPTTCVIAGTPTGVAAAQDYTITASNSGGSGNNLVNLAVTSAPPGNIVLNGIASFTTANCSMYTLTVRDAYGNPSNVSADTTFNLSGAGTGGAFYSDSMCTSTTTSATVTNGTSSIVFYYQKSAVGSATLTATLSSPVSPALGSATRNVNVSLSTPAKYGVVVSPTGTTVSCNLVTINVLDSNNNSVNATSALTVNLSATGGATTYYSDAACTATVTTRPIAIGANSATAYLRKTSVGASTLTAASSGMASGTASIAISVGPAARVVFNTPPAVPYASGTCQTYALQARDSLGNNASAVTADTTVSLSGVADGSFYSTAGCPGGSEITSTTITNGTSARTVYFKKPTATASNPGANITLTASVVGWTPNATTSVSTSSATQINLATANGAAGIAVSTATNVAAASRCLTTTVRVQDELNVLVPAANVVSPITANLSGGGAGAQFWSNAACTTPTSTVTINAGSNTGNFYYSSTSTTGGAVPISWDNGGLGGSGGSRNVTVTSGVPSRLTWTAGPSSYAANTCQTYTFNVRDSNTVTSIGANVSSNTIFSLSDGSDGTFYSGAGCVGSISTVQVNSGAQAATFYYRKLTATPPAATISVALNSPVSPAITTLNQALTVTLAPNNIAISATPSSSLVATQSCSAVTVQSRNGVTPANVTSNTTVTLSANNGGTYYYDAGCTAVASPNTITIASGSNSASGLYIKTANTGNVTLSGTASITVNNLVLTYAAPPPTQLAISGPILLNAGSSCGFYTVTTQDGGGIPRNVSSNTTITATSTGAVGLTFYSNASCTTPLPADEVTVSSGSSTASFYATGAVVGSAQVTVTGGSLTAANQNVTVQ